MEEHITEARLGLSERFLLSMGQAAVRNLWMFHASLLVVFVWSAAVAVAGPKPENLLHVESKRNFKQVADALPVAAKANGFAVVTTHPMTESLKKKGFDVGGQVTVFEVCNGRYAAEVLEKQPEMASLLPCRIAVREASNTVILETVRPTVLLGTVATGGEIGSVAAEVEAAMLKIMKAAAGE